jgi:hypothetical protein
MASAHLPLPPMLPRCGHVARMRIRVRKSAHSAPPVRCVLSRPGVPPPPCSSLPLSALLLPPLLRSLCPLLCSPLLCSALQRSAGAAAKAKGDATEQEPGGKKRHKETAGLAGHAGSMLRRRHIAAESARWGRLDWCIHLWEASGATTVVLALARVDREAGPQRRPNRRFGHTGGGRSRVRCPPCLCCCP